MRAWPLALLLAMPWAGCVESNPTLLTSTIFTFDRAVRGDPSLLPVERCDDLLETLNGRALDEARVGLEQSVEGYGNGWGLWRMDGDVVALEAADSAASAPASPSTAPASGAQVTGTNNQEAAADEGDLVKTDGEWTYVLSEGRLHVLHSLFVGDAEEVATMDLGGWGGELLLERRDPQDPADDRLVAVIPAGYDARPMEGILEDSLYAGSYATRVLVLGLADRANPTIETEILVEGDARGSRLVDGTAYVVVHQWPEGLGLETWVDGSVLYEEARMGSVLAGGPADGSAIQETLRKGRLKELAREADGRNQERLAELTLEDHLPAIVRVEDGTATEDGVGPDVCQRFLTTPGATGRGVTTILAIAADEAGLPTSTTQVSGSSPIVYASGTDLVLAAPSQDLWWFWAQPDLLEATDLQWLALDGLSVTPKASGRVPGTVLDSFALDVEGDQLRVATTTGTWGRWWDGEPEPMLSHVAVFDAVAGALVPAGIVGGIAPGERIWSVRFTEERAYVVTFRNMDPLWVVDLTGTPEILGELEIPGVSTYIHPLDDGALLTIGYGGGPDGLGLDWGTVQLSLFDVSDPSQPRKADSLDFATGGYSAAVDEHRAFTYWPALGALAVPLTSGTYDEATGAYDSQAALKLVLVDREGLALNLRGEVEQGLAGPEGYPADIQRNYFLGYPEGGPVSVYSVSPLGVAAHDFHTLAPQDSVRFGQQ